MKHSTPFHKVIARNKGIFSGQNFLISSDSINWIHSYSLSINSSGQLYSNDENDTHYLLLQSLQSCYVQIYPTLNVSNPSNHTSKKKLLKKSSNGSLNNTSNTTTLPKNNNGNSNNANAHDEPPVIFIKTYDNEKIYIKVPSKSNFGNLISSLIVWQSLKPAGLVKKWYCDNKVFESTSSSSTPHELLVCRYKIYGPIPSKQKNLKIVPGPKAPIYQANIFDSSNFESLTNLDSNNNNHHHQSHQQNSNLDNINEGWFYTMGVLKSNGMLNFISELDGTLLYSIDIKSMMSSEIREVHHSIFDSSNILFIGQIKELRWNNIIKSISTTNSDLLAPHNAFLTKDCKPIHSNQRILIEFPLHIDLEDWFVGLNYFAKREYIGSFNEKSSLKLNPPFSNIAPSSNIRKNSTISLNNDDNDSTINDTTFSSFNSSGRASNPATPTASSFSFANNQSLLDQPLNQSSNQSSSTNLLPPLSDYSKDNFRVSKKVGIDIIEAKFDEEPLKNGKIYAEVVMWGLPWSRTAMVNYSINPFWKEEFSTDLPILTQIVHILIKKCSSNNNTYSSKDKLIGTVYITPDILIKQLNTNSTMMMSGSAGNNGINGGNLINTSSIGNDIVRLSIYDSTNLPIGKLLLTVNLKEYHILSPSNFKTLESMLLNAPMKDLIKYCNDNVPTSDFENVSLIMLDIFQSLGIEDKWFKSLMEVELVNVDKMTRKNYVNRNNPTSSSSNNVFNTLFRGSSIFSKSLEKYNLRIGQEYLEKVFGDFFSKVSEENKSCEIDPRYVRLQEKAERKGKTTDSLENGSDDSDDDSDGYDSDVEKERETKIKSMVEENFNNLYHYAEEIWNKIYITSNDLPQQIKIQLKNFRTKVDLACDPDDKVTALNCLSAFIFLRFFCPAILNPKLFYLTKNHQTGKTQRTLTLIAKILLNLANRQEFSPHKEPHLVKMNRFLKEHHDDIYDYFDKITGRKNDFNEKILDLSHEVKRFDLGLSGDSTSNELPTTPYLIDKYLRLTQFIHLLNLKGANLHHHSSSISSINNTSTNNGTNGNGNGNYLLPTTSSGNKISSSNSSISISTTLSANESVSTLQQPPQQLQQLQQLQQQLQQQQARGSINSQNQLNNNSSSLFHQRDSSRESNGDIHINNEKNVYQIGSLEFEKLEFLDLVGDNETEGFIKSLCRSNENIFSFITSNITLKDIQKQSTNLMNKISDLLIELELPEYPENFQNDQLMWDSFTIDILSRAYLDTSRNAIVFYDSHFQDGIPHNYKKITDNALGLLKLKFQDINFDNDSSNNTTDINFNSSNSLGSVTKTTKNPFKKWLRRN